MKPHISSPSSSQVCRRPFSIWSIALGALVVSTTGAFAQPAVALTELATPAGYDFSIPYGINDQGFLVGAATNVKGQTAVVWKNGAVAVLGRLKDGTYSIATAINSKGVITGEGDDGDGRPLGWVTSGSSLVNFFSNNGGNTHPVSIDDASQIGGYYVKGFSSTWRGGLWKIDPKDPRKSILTELPVLPGGDPTTASATAWAFNKYAQAAGNSANSTIGQHAVFWNNDPAHTIVDLGVFGSDWSSLGYALNDYGQVVGSSHPPFGSRAILWQNDAAHTPVELPLLPGGNYGSAQFINNRSTIIGYSTTSEPGTWNVAPSQTAIWIDGLVYDLQALLSASFPAWTQVQVMAINNFDQIACFATRNGVTRPIVLTVIR